MKTLMKEFSGKMMMKAGSLLLVILLMAWMAPDADAQRIAVKGETVYTMNGDPIRDGVVLIRDGQIENVGRASRVRIPERL